MKLSNELLDTLKMLLDDRQNQANSKLHDAYAKCVSYQHFSSHTQYIQQCVRELDSLQNQLNEVVSIQQIRNTVNINNDELAEQYTRLHDSDE